MSPLPRWLAPTLIVLAGALLTMLTISRSAQADFYYSEPLANQKDTGFCIGIGGGSLEVNAHAGLYHCDGRPNQQYRFLGNTSEAKIRVNNGTGLCLKVSSTFAAEGSRQVYQGSCNSDRARWRLRNFQDSFGGAGNTSRLASIESVFHPGLCIGAGGGQMFNGNVIKAYGCGFTTYGNQNWVVNPNRRVMP